MQRLTLLLVLFLLFGTSACALTSGSTTPGVSSNRIIVDRLPASVSSLSAYEIVDRYRPQWLRKRGESSINAPLEVSVYLDKNRSRYGPPSSLQQIQAMDVDSIEYLSDTQAQAEYGLDNIHGAIVVHTKQGH